ncbi:hypothetical protein [Micromonospora sp. NPDC049891]|uniref:hypothetical protein n=1 Tax=Micromonospora sp. NPDC049891 TaxID=3155655 RepID=UPI00340F82C2
MTDAPWALPHGYGGPSRYQRLPDWEVHTTTNTDGRRLFVLRNTATGHTEDLPSEGGLYAALDWAEMQIARHAGTTEHLSDVVLSLLDDDPGRRTP